jgi:hypothetical protein
MRRFQAIIGLWALLVLGTQTLRHGYILCVEPRESVLDKYESTKQTIAETDSLDELLVLYEAARQKVLEAEKADPPPKREDRYDYDYSRLKKEPFKSEGELEDAILEWESHNRQLHEVHFYWISGVVLAMVGAGVYLKIQQWAGIAICSLATLEMIWATSPSFRTFGSPAEFDRLLAFKLIYSACSVAILLVGWVIASRVNRQVEASTLVEPS